MSIISQLQSALDSILPSSVSGAASEVTHGEVIFDYPEEGKHLKNAVPSRKNEFIVGRRCARTALEKVGQVSVTLPSGANRVPQWPVGTVGSISHSRGLCCAVAASADCMLSLGVDLESTNRISSSVLKRILHLQETKFVGEDQVLGSLVFSAKEAFFKTQFPVFGVWPNFEDIALKVDMVNEKISVEAVAAYLPNALREAALNMDLRYRFFENYVLVVCWLRSN